MKFNTRRTTMGLGLMAAAALAVTGCTSNGTSPGGGEDDPDFFAGRQIEAIVPTSAGGGFDTTMRQLQPYLEKALGATVIVRNIEGGNHAIGIQAALNRTQDCTTFFFEGLPHLNFSFLGEGQGVDYDLDEIAPLVGVSIEPGVIRVQNDAPWQTMEEFIEEARERPGQVRISISDFASNNYIGLQQLQEATGVEFNIVPYDGGGPSRTALLSGEVEATHAGVFNSQSIAEDTRVLAVQYSENRWADASDDAPTFSDALGVDVPDNFSNYITAVAEGCRADYPDRWQQLVDGLNEALEDPEYHEMLDSLGELGKLNILQPDELEQQMHAVSAQIIEFYGTDR